MQSNDQSEIAKRIDELGAIADKRKSEASDWHVALTGGAGVAYLNPDELAELHELKLKLPTFAQLRGEAKQRIEQRIRGVETARGLKNKAVFESNRSRTIFDSPEALRMASRAIKEATDELDQTPRHLQDKGNPNHPQYDTIFGYEREAFMARQYK